jgi:hypothetical protein
LSIAAGFIAFFIADGRVEMQSQDREFHDIPMAG